MSVDPRHVKCVIDGLLADDWKSTKPYAINCGECEEFAGEVFDILVDGHDPLIRRDGSPPNVDVVWGPRLCLPSHAWLHIDERHYDAECPEGVDLWKELPMFARLRQGSETEEIYGPILDELSDDLEEALKQEEDFA